MHSSLLIMGIGNALKGDDGVGPYVAELLATETVAGAQLSGMQLGIQSIDCGTVPENYTGVIRRLHPDHLVLVDAAEMGLPVGAVRVIPADAIGALGLSTHSMPLSMFMSYVADLAGRVTLVGIQPESMLLGREMCEKVRVAGEKLAQILRAGGLAGVPLLGDDSSRL
jgi:hydrogenase 3 maturation protease